MRLATRDSTPAHWCCGYCQLGVVLDVEVVTEDGSAHQDCVDLAERRRVEHWEKYDRKQRLQAEAEALATRRLARRQWLRSLYWHPLPYAVFGVMVAIIGVIFLAVALAGGPVVDVPRSPNAVVPQPAAAPEPAPEGMREALQRFWLVVIFLLLLLASCTGKIGPMLVTVAAVPVGPVLVYAEPAFFAELGRAVIELGEPAGD